MKSPLSYTQARDCDFLRHCIEIARKSPGLTLSEVVKLALKQRPEYYYIEFDHASRIVHRVIVHQQPLRYAREEARKQAEDLVERVRSTALKRNITLRAALSHVLNNNRPKQFYISYRQAMRIAQRKLKNMVTVK